LRWADFFAVVDFVLAAALRFAVAGDFLLLALVADFGFTAFLRPLVLTGVVVADFLVIGMF
jgi:hypothetical protein